MSNTTKGLTTLCIPLLSVLILFSSCESPGSVGEDYVDRSELTFDTLSLSNLQSQNYIGYTGRLNHLAIGNYSDPIFGDISTFSFLKPTFNINLPEGDSLDDSYSLKLKLMIDSTFTYGDTSGPLNYSVYEVSSYWNGLNIKIDEDVTYDESSLVGTFTHQGEDSVIIDLADSWKQTYADFVYSPEANDDSLLQYEFKGLAIVAETGANRIIQPSISRNSFLAINSDSIPDTTSISLRDWAFSIDRTGENYQNDVTPLHSTIENLIHFSLEDLIKTIEGRNFIKAELVFFEASDIMDNTLQAMEVRPDINNIYLNIGEENEDPYDLQLSSSEILGSKRSSDNTFRINVTSYFNNYLFGNEDRTNLYLTVGSSIGGVRSTLVYNELAPEPLQPKLILTFLEGEEN